MTTNFQNKVVYEKLRSFSKDLYIFTSKLPNYESNGLIKRIRDLAMGMLETYAQGHIRTAHSSHSVSIENCLISVAKVTALIDLCARLDYITPQSLAYWIMLCQEMTKTLYDDLKTN